MASTSSKTSYNPNGNGNGSFPRLSIRALLFSGTFQRKSKRKACTSISEGICSCIIDHFSCLLLKVYLLWLTKLQCPKFTFPLLNLQYNLLISVSVHFIISLIKY